MFEALHLCGASPPVVRGPYGPGHMARAAITERAPAGAAHRCGRESTNWFLRLVQDVIASPRARRAPDGIRFRHGRPGLVVGPMGPRREGHGTGWAAAFIPGSQAGRPNASQSRAAPRQSEAPGDPEQTRTLSATGRRTRSFKAAGPDPEDDAWAGAGRRASCSRGKNVDAREDGENAAEGCAPC